MPGSPPMRLTPSFFPCWPHTMRPRPRSTGSMLGSTASRMTTRNASKSLTNPPRCLAWRSPDMVPREGVIMAINIVDLNVPGQAHVDSYWASTAGPEMEGAAPVAGEMEVDMAIVGGGYTRLSTALHLGRKFGLKSHVLEANRIGWGCSGRNGGFAVLGIGKTSMAGWIRRWGEAEARHIFDQS